jgi:general secretion pathway protein G
MQVQNMRGTRRISDGGLDVRIRNPQSGFTLIELMLVLVILATLSAIVVPKLTGHSKRAKVIAAGTQIADFGTALDAFEIDVGRYPTTVEGMRALLERPTSEADDWRGPYLSKNVVPPDPWGGEYQYRCPGQYNPDGYDLYSYGPDQKMGGDDDITNWSEDVRR